MTSEGDKLLSDALGDVVDDAIREKNSIKMEALEHLWRAIPYGYEFELSNGMTGRITKFFEPRDIINDEHVDPEAGIDVALIKDGRQVGEIEFVLHNTGWGMMVTPPGDDKQPC